MHPWRTIGGRSRLACACAGAALLLAACATPAPEPPPAPVLPPVVVAPPACPSCDEQVKEVARLTQELAARDAELRELKSAQREQAKSAQETTREAAREVTRAKAKARRLATQADAASYLAEVEVAIGALRGNATAAVSPLPALATAYLALAAEPFARGDYARAMERASQAEEVVGLAARPLPSGRKPARPPVEVALQVPLPLHAATDADVRRQPRPKAPRAGVMRKDAVLTAFGWQDGWLRIQTTDGVAGWVEPAAVGAR